MSKICGSPEVLIKVHECRQIQPVPYQVLRGSSFRAVRESCPSDTTVAAKMLCNEFSPRNSPIKTKLTMKMRIPPFALATIVLVQVGVAAQTNEPADDWKPATSNQPGKQYPQVNSEGRVRARVSRAASTERRCFEFLGGSEANLFPAETTARGLALRGRRTKVFTIINW